MSAKRPPASNDHISHPSDPEGERGLHAVQADSQEHTPATSETRPLGAFRVLLVEDDFHDADYIRSELTHSPIARFDVVHVKELSPALERLARERFDVVLLDLFLPDSEGIETITRVRRHTSRLPVVALAPAESDALSNQVLTSGAQDLVVKDPGVGIGKLLSRTLIYAIEQKQAEENLRFFVDAGTSLSASLDYDDVLKCISDLAVDYLAGWCLISILDDAARVERTYASSDMAQKNVDQGVKNLQNDSPQRDSDTTSDLSSQVAQVISTRKPLLLADVSPGQVAEVVEQLGGTEAWHNWLSTRGSITGRASASELLSDATTSIVDLAEAGSEYTSMLLAPLVIRGHVLGLLTLVDVNRGRPYGTYESRLGKGLAERAALALDNARLYKEVPHAMEARENLLAEVSHDLRTPLTSIRAGLGLLNMSLEEGQLAPEQTELLNKVRRNAERLTTMVGDLLAYNAMKSGSLPMESDLVNASDIVRAAGAIMEPMFRAKNQQVTMHLEEPLLIMGDGRYLEHALVNLLDNAHNHTPEGTTITVQAGAVSNEVVLVIRDNGPGIALEDQEKIFQQFYRAASSRRTAGLGLGLSLVRTIIEGSGGRIWVDSAPGKGTAFIMVLPHASDSNIEAASQY